MDEAGLTSSDVCSGSIAHHGDVEALRFFHVTLVEELVEEQIGPLDAEFKLPERCRNIASVKGN